MNNKEIRKKSRKVKKACEEALYSMKEYKDFRAEVHYRHINWDSKRDSVIASIPADVDNLIRNIAYHEGVTFSKAMKMMFDTHFKQPIKKLSKKYPQRPCYNDWRAYRTHIQNHSLSEKGKKLDKYVRKMFDEMYGSSNASVAV